MRQRLYAFITVPFFAVLYVYTAAGVLVVLLLAAMKLEKPIPGLSRLWARSVFLIMGKNFPVTGKERIDRNKRYILVANHSSLFDIVAITSFYPGISWFGHERLLRIPVFGAFLRMTGYVPFSEPNYRNTKRMVEELSDRSLMKTVAIFPEGTRTVSGKINSFYRGFICLYRKCDLEILPVTLNGFYRLKPKNRNYIDFSSKLGVIIHEPVRREALAGKSDQEITEHIRTIIESAYSEYNQNNHHE
jgi:1-acyl-sn-glycerol-3-phosphate acyltransferase